MSEKKDSNKDAPALGKIDRNKLPEDFIQAIKDEVKRELLAEEAAKAEEIKRQKEALTKARNEYIEKMKASSEPWVDIEGWDEGSGDGVKVELEWNDAFIKQLRDEGGLTGSDDDQVIQKWLILLMQDMASQMEETTDGGEFE